MDNPLRFFLALWILLILSGCAGRPVQEIAQHQDAKAAEINLQLGVGYMQSGHFDVALEKLNKALEYDPNLEEAHNAIAVLYEEIKEYELAEQHYRRAVRLNPDYALARMNYGRFLCRYQRPAEGESQFLAAANNPKLDSPEAAYIGAGVCAKEIPALERAEAHLGKALELNPDAAHALFELAELNYAQGNYLQARTFLQRYHPQAGYSPASLWLGINIEKALGDSRLRREYADLLLSKFSASKEAQRLRSE